MNKTRMNKNKKNSKKNKKLTGGTNIAQASINTIMSGVNLALSMFDAFDGVVNMPRDLNRAVDKSQLNAPGQTQPVSAQPMPRNEVKNVQ